MNLDVVQNDCAVPSLVSIPEVSRRFGQADTKGEVAYILKGFPRLSETFIASEIYRLEQQGMPLRLFVIKPTEEKVRHPVVDRIQAIPDYLPNAGSISHIPVHHWLALYGPTFFPALRHVATCYPLGVGHAAAFAFGQAVRARETAWSWPRKMYLKEFFQAVTLAERLSHTPSVRHLHAHFCHSATTVTWLTSMITGLPFSFTAHAKDIYDESLNPAGLLRRKLDAAQFVVTCTEANRQHLRRLGSNTPIHRVYHGVNVDFSRLLAHQKIESPRTAGSSRFLGVGRIVAKKGFDTFVEACGLLHRRARSFSGVIAGEDGEHGAILRQRIADLGLSDYFRFTGPLRQDQLYQEYRQASIFCLPCRVLDNGDRDGIPNVLMEAMACGLPIISTNISGIPELVTHEMNGLLVPPDDPTVLAEALDRLHNDPMLARRLGRAAQATVLNHFDGERLARQLLALFQ